jgi:hypothetical protein
VWKVGSIPFAKAIDSLQDADIGRVRSDLADAVSPYRSDDGGCVFPMACRLFYGRK